MSRAHRGACIRRRKSKKGFVWQVRWRERGRLFSKTFQSEGEADHFAHQASVIKDAQSVVAASMPNPAKITDHIPIYVDLVRAKNKPGSSHAEQVQGMLRLAVKRMSVEWVHEIDSSAMDRLVRSYGKHRSTLRKSISVLKTFLRWARRSRWLVDEWVFDYKAPKHVPLERNAWNEEQASRLMAVFDSPSGVDEMPSGIGSGRGSPLMVSRMAATKSYLSHQAVRPALWLFLRYGPRPKEMCQLRIGNWDAPSRTLHFPGDITKNGHPRTFVVDEETAQVLTTSAGGRSPRDWLFLNSRKGPWSSQHMSNVMNVLVRRAGVPGTAYCGRHTASSRLMGLANGDIPLVQSITGHRTLSELQRYLHTTKDRQQAIAEAYNRQEKNRDEGGAAKAAK